MATSKIEWDHCPECGSDDDDDLIPPDDQQGDGLSLCCERVIVGECEQTCEHD